MTFEPTTCNTPRPGYVETTTMKLGNHSASPSNAARITWIRRAAKSTTAYLPGTHPAFENNVAALMKVVENDSHKIEISKWQAKLLAGALRKLRIRINVDTRCITLSELEEMCVEKISEEAFAFARYELETGEAKTIALDIYNFVKQCRVDLEIEIQRCNRHDKAEPTPHATISEASRKKLRNIFPHNTLHRTFMSVGELFKAINGGIMQFLTWPERAHDRLAVVEEILKSNTRNTVSVNKLKN